MSTSSEIPIGGFTSLSSLRVKGRKMVVICGAAVSAAALLTGPVTSVSAATKTCHSANGYKVSGSDAANVCAGLKYYAGKTITFVAPDSPGGGFDTQARIYAPYLAKYLGAQVNVLNIPAGSTVAGMNYVAGTNSVANGLTTGWLNYGAIIQNKILGTPGIQFNPAGEVTLGATGAGLSAVLALKSASCAQWDGGFNQLLANQSASNPITEPVNITGTATVTLLNLNGTFGLHYRALAGYSSTSQQLAGWLRGDGCVIYTAITSAVQYVVSGQAVPLLVNLPVPQASKYYSYFSNVPSFAQAEKAVYTKKHPATKLEALGAIAVADSSGGARVLFVPPKTPKIYQAALRSAFKFAGMNPNLVSQELQLGSEGGYLSPKQCKSLYLTWLASGLKVKQFLAPLGG